MMNAISNLADKTLSHPSTTLGGKPLVDEKRRMQCLVWNGKMDVECVERPMPLITDARDIVLKVTATSISGNDLHMYSGAMMGTQKGDILGHEFMGVVEDVGPEVKKLMRGQRVVVACDIACGNCENCRRLEYTSCDAKNPHKLIETVYGQRTSALFGSHFTGALQGGQAQFVRVPFADVNCLPVPDDIPDEKALYLSDIIPTSFHGTELAGIKEGSTVAIWGLGPIGLMAARWCQIKKAARIIGIDCVPERLALARNFLKIETINFKEQDTCKTLAALVPGGVDCGIECAGFENSTTLRHKVERAVGLETDSADILTEMIHSVKKFGRISIVGTYSGTTNHFPIGAFMEKGLVMSACQSPTQKYWNMCLEKIRSGEIDPTFMISHRGTLTQGPELYKNFYDRKDGVVKVFIRTGASPAH